MDGLVSFQSKFRILYLSHVLNFGWPQKDKKILTNDKSKKWSMERFKIVYVRYNDIFRIWEQHTTQVSKTLLMQIWEQAITNCFLTEMFVIVDQSQQR